MTWLQDLNIYVQAMIYSSFIVGLLLIVLTIVYILKPTLSKAKLKYVYAFTSGFIMITAVIGQFAESREHIMEHFGGEDAEMSAGQIVIAMTIVLTGILTGVIVTLLITRFVKTDTDVFEGTKDPIPSRSKIPAIFMILAHRIPAGLTMGVLIYESQNGDAHPYALATLIVFIIHIIPELIIVYYGFRDSNKSKGKSFVYSILVKLPLIPMMIIGVVIGEAIGGSESLYWLFPWLFAVVATVMLWAVFSELVPEFAGTRYMWKSVNLLTVVFFVGVATSLLIQLVHHH